jgi:hypothetical protein
MQSTPFGAGRDGDGHGSGGHGSDGHGSGGQGAGGQGAGGQGAGGGGAGGRDRDAAGRPRNARPRDALGRPLGYGSQGVPRDLPPPAGSPAESLEQAQRLLDAGRPFEAHEVLEDAWKAAPEAERDLWRGLAQLAVGLTHAGRGNRTGAAALLARGAVNLAGYRDAAPHRVDVPGLLDWAALAGAALAAATAVPDARATAVPDPADARATAPGAAGMPRLVSPSGRP